MSTVRYSKQATKTLCKMPSGTVNKIQAAMLNIAKNPTAYQGDWKRLEGTDFWRLRVGSWRVVCDVQNGELLILVLKIAQRGDVYK
jgi:mRNA interferase RelE/StbE